jgi:heme-degrading monooxygenase HmoA
MTTVITPFEVPAEHEAEFTAAWKAMSQVAARLPGYRAARLHRSRGTARFRFVGLSMWDSEQSVSGALADPTFAAALAALDCRSYPSLYDVAIEATRDA